MSSFELPLFPLGTILFPEGRLPLRIFEVRYLDMIGKCVAGGSGFGVVALIRGREVRVPGASEAFCPVGTVASVIDSNTPVPGLMEIECRGQSRFRIVSSEQLKHGLWMAQAETIADDSPVPVPDELGDTVAALEKLLAALEDEHIDAKNMPFAPPYRFDDAGWVANRWCELLPLALEQKQRLLELQNPLLRLELVQDALAQHGLLD